MINTALNKIYLYISSRNPFTYMLIYLALVPVYAYAYYCCQGGFFAPYSHLEPNWIEHSNSIALLLKKSLKYSSVYSNIPDDINIKEVSTDGQELDFTIKTSYVPKELHMFTYLKEAGILYTNRDERMIGCHYFYIYRKQGDMAEWENQNILFYSRSILQFIGLSESESNEVNAYVKSFNGLGPNVNDDIARMGYLSAVVVTTLGLGDIVPLTPLARGLVGSEAIFGVLFAGLFLNALAYRASGAVSGRRN